MLHLLAIYLQMTLLITDGSEEAMGSLKNKLVSTELTREPLLMLKKTVQLNNSPEKQSSYCRGKN